MKKKILSGILALGMLMSTLVVPAYAAPVTAPDETYSEVYLNETHDSGTLTDGPDGTAYTQITAETNIMNVGAASRSESLMSFDFRFDDAAATMTFKNGKGKIGPGLSLLDGTLRNEYKGNTYQTIGTGIEVGQWYSMELEGKFVAVGAHVVLRLYKWEDGAKKLINTVDGLELRNFYAGSGNGDFEFIAASAGISVDNEYAASLYATDVVVSSLKDDMKAGETAQLSAVAQRDGKDVTTPEFVWEVYNAEGTELLNDENVTITAGGLLSAGAQTATQTVTVRATAQSKSNPYGEYKVNITAVDTSNDKYDKLVLSTEDDKSTVRAGEPLTIIPIATMAEEEVTLGEGDVVWTVYNSADLREVGNKYITIENGVLSVTDKVVPQTLTIRGTNPSGSVTGTFKVDVLPAGMNYGNEDMYSDTFASADACEEYLTVGASVEDGSWDGSGYYSVTNELNFVGFNADTNADVIYSADMQFANDGAGWTVYSANRGKLGLQLSTSGTTLNAIGASNKATALLDIEKDAWYNIQVMCATGNDATGTSYATFVAYKYDENGNKINPKTGEAGVPFISTAISLRNLSASQANHIAINAGTHVDNVMNMYVAPDKLTISIDAETVLAGGSAQASTTASRLGVDFPFISTNLIKYEIYDAEDKYPLGDDKISIGPDGKITIDPLATTQDVYVRVSSASGGMYDSKLLKVVSSDIFEITAAGFNEDYSELVRIEFNKNLDYSDDVSFISAVYGADGAMKTVMFKRAYGDQLVLGANRLAMNMAMPDGFDKINDRLNVFAITKLPVSKAVAPDATVTATKTEGGLSIVAPEFDAKTSVVILVLKTDNPTSVTQADIAYFNQVDSGAVPTEIKIDGDYSGEYTVEIAGMINGIHTIKSATTAAE